MTEAFLDCELDAALHELGMLSTVTNARLQYVESIRPRSLTSPPHIKRISEICCANISAEEVDDSFNEFLNIELNSRYVSHVTIGHRMKISTPSKRYRPYTMRERNRTKSENSDNYNNIVVNTEVVPSDPVLGQISQIKDFKFLNDSLVINQEIKKSKSLEDVHIGNLDEMESVATGIEKLNVQ